MAEHKWVTGVISPLFEWSPTYNWFLGPPCGDSAMFFVELKIETMEVGGTVAPCFLKNGRCS